MQEKISTSENKEAKDKNFFNDILDEYKDRGLTENGNEFILTKGDKKFHFLKWRELPLKRDGKIGSIKVRDYIENLLNEKE